MINIISHGNGPASRIPLNFELESRILIDKKVLQYFCSFELSMETFPVGSGGVLIIFVKSMIK